MKNIINIEDVNKTKQKIDMYNKEESIKINSIETQFDNLNLTLDIENNSMENIKTELRNKLITIKKIHENNSIVLIKNANKYEDAALKTNQIFDNIDRG